MWRNEIDLNKLELLSSLVYITRKSRGNWADMNLCNKGRYTIISIDMGRLLTNFLCLPDRLICQSKIDQAERFAWFAWAGLIRLGRGAWFAWAGLIRLERGAWFAWAGLIILLRQIRQLSIHWKIVISLSYYDALRYPFRPPKLLLGPFSS